MAVKVMLAPVIAHRAQSPAQEKGPEPRPRRRRSSVFDAEGNEVFITLMCLKCHKMRPLSQFGLRRMADGAIRNQPWCRPCRSGASAENPRRRKDASSDTSAPFPVAAEPAAAAVRPLDAGTLAAQVVAALHGGRR